MVDRDVVLVADYRQVSGSERGDRRILAAAVCAIAAANTLNAVVGEAAVVAVADVV